MKNSFFSSASLGILAVSTAISAGISAPLLGQLIRRDERVFYAPAQTQAGVIVKADTHTFFSCPEGTTTSLESDAITASTRYWGYEYPARARAKGVFFVSAGELKVNPQYNRINELKEIVGGRGYYFTTQKDLFFQCEKGFQLNASILPVSSSSRSSSKSSQASSARSSQVSSQVSSQRPVCAAPFCAAPPPGCRYENIPYNEDGCQTGCGTVVCSSSSTSSVSPGDHQFRITHGGTNRFYILHVPPSYKPGVQMPLILNFHGGGDSAANIASQYKMNATSNAENFLVAYPQGVGPVVDGKIHGTWNAGKCCGGAMNQNIDDVGFTEAVIDDIASRFSLDKRKVYATGISNGGLMSYRLACELADKIAAIAPVGTPVLGFEGCAPSRPVPIIHFHGTDDPCALYQGGMCGGCVSDSMGGTGAGNQMACGAVSKIVDAWRGINRLSDKRSTIFENDSVNCVLHGPGEPGQIALCSIRNMGHRWPGAGVYALACAGGINTAACQKNIQTFGPFSDAISANDAMWQFFKAIPTTSTSSSSLSSQRSSSSSSCPNGTILVGGHCVYDDRCINGGGFCPPSSWSSSRSSQGPVCSLPICPAIAPGSGCRYGDAPVDSNGCQGCRPIICSSSSSVRPECSPPACPTVMPPAGCTFGDYPKDPNGCLNGCRPITCPSSSSKSSVQATPMIRLTSPNGGETLTLGTTFTIRWTSANLPADTNIFIATVSSDGTRQFNVAGPLPNTGSYNWTIPQDQFQGAQRFFVTAHKMQQLAIDNSDGVINIWPNPQLKVVYPKGGEQLAVGTSVTVKWESAYFPQGSKMRLSVLSSDSTTERVIAEAAENTGSYTWNIPTNQLLGAHRFVISSNNISTNGDVFTFYAPQPERTVRMDQPLAVHTSGGFPQLNDLGSKWERIIIRWLNETKQPEKPVASMDQLITEAQKYDVTVVPTLRAISELSEAGQPVRNFSNVPDMTAWLAFVKASVERYDMDGQSDMPGLTKPLNHWEIENEWLWQWKGTTEQLVSFVRQTSAAMRQANPNVKVISPSFTFLTAFAIEDGMGDRNYIQRGETDAAYQEIPVTVYGRDPEYIEIRKKVEQFIPAIRDYVDIFDIHVYSEDPTDLALASYWLKARNNNKPVWSHETSGPFHRFSVEKTSSDIVKRYVTGIMAGVEKIFWHSLYPIEGWTENYGRLALIGPNNVKRPAFYTYKIMSDKFDQMESLTKVSSPDDVFVYRLNDDGGVVRYVAWSKQPVSHQITWTTSPKILVTHIITSANQTTPATETLVPVNGKLMLPLSPKPFFFEAQW